MLPLMLSTVNDVVTCVVVDDAKGIGAAYRQGMEVVGVAEIAGMLGGISRQRANVIANSKGFPDPVFVLKMGKAWDKAQVEAWIAKNRPNLAGSGEA